MGPSCPDCGVGELLNGVCQAGCGLDRAADNILKALERHPGVGVVHLAPAGVRVSEEQQRINAAFAADIAKMFERRPGVLVIDARSTPEEITRFNREAGRALQDRLTELGDLTHNIPPAQMSRVVANCLGEPDRGSKAAPLPEHAPGRGESRAEFKARLGREKTRDQVRRRPPRRV